MLTIGGQTWRRVGALLAVASLAAGAAAPGAAGQPAFPGVCPPVLATDDVVAGMTGIGLTVTSGTDPDVFTADVLGVLENGIAPGRDLILASLTGAPIEAAGGGIAFGYSGSPVYVNDGGVMKLAGAVAYALAFGPSPVAGLTPAEDMDALFDLERSAGTADPEPARIELTHGERRALAATLGAPAATVGEALLRLKVPLAVSGANARALERVREAVARQRLPLVPHAAGMVGATVPAEEDPEAGGSFAAALSYGDVGFAALGTTTAVCDGMAVAFGHPFSWEGRTTWGANAADTITIVQDPIFGAYKLAQVGGTYGRVDQDRLAGLRALLGPGPRTTPVSSTVTSLGTGRSRSGTSESVLGEFLPFLASIHLLVNIDVTIDRIGEGNSLLTWRIGGTRESGERWSFTRTNRYSSRWDISGESIGEISSHLEAIAHNPFEDVEITGVEVRRADVADEARQYTLKRLLVSRNGLDYAPAKRVVVRAGRTISLVALLKPNEESTLHAVEMRLRVPKFRRPTRGFIQVGSGFRGGFGDACFLGECEGFGDDGEEGEEAERSFPELLKKLAFAPQNHRLAARLFAGPDLRQRTKARRLLDRVVAGKRVIRVVVRPRR